MGEILNRILAIKRELEQHRFPVGVVCRPEIKLRVRAMAEQVNAETIFPASFGFGLEVFSDSEQTEDCLVFYDRKLMIAYLHRNEEPVAYAKALLAGWNG